MGKYVVSYYVKARVYFEAEVNANSENEAIDIIENDLGDEEHEEIDWETLGYKIQDIEEVEDDDE